MKRKREDEESDGGVLKKSDICRFEDCTKYSSFGYVGDDERATRCKEHQLPKMVDVKNKRCETPGCDKQPSYAEFGKPRAFCKDHKLPDMVNVINKRCQQSGCDKIPSYAKHGEKIPAFCKDHKLPDMVNVVSKRCETPGCDTRPNFAIFGNRAAYCKKCKKDGMVDVTHKRCQQSGCDKIPIFAKHGEPAAYCADHMVHGEMVDVVNKRCETPGCNNHPIYADLGKTRAFCKKCKKDGMVDVTHKRCQKPGCDKIPTYAEFGDPAAFCKQCKKDGMVNVVSKRCETPGCTTRALYGYLTFPPERCAQHQDSENTMVFNPTARCIIKGCREIATSGKASKRQHCSDHAQPGEISFAKQMCACGEMTMLSPKSQLCVGCDPNYSMVKRVKMEENAVRSLLVHNGYKHFVYDRALPDNCGMTYRPDFLFEKPGFFVTLEVDEHQHKTYHCAGHCICEPNDMPCECEYKRMREITFINTLPTLFLRFNPHKYKTKGSMKSIAARHDELLRVLKQSLIDGPKARCEVKYLFYDESVVPSQIVVATE